MAFERLITMTVVSLAITFVLLVVSAVLLVKRLQRKGRIPRGAVTGVDVFARAFVELGKKVGDPLLAGILWILVSSLLGFGLPVLTGRGSFILEPSEFIIMLDYCLFVPMLLGAYIFLIRSLGFFNAKHIQGSGHIPNITLQKWFWAYQFALLIATIVVQYQAINSEIKLPSPCSPWVTFAEKDLSLAWPCRPAEKEIEGMGLSLPGVFYYALRGIDTFMALGLVFTVAATWFLSREQFRDVALVDFRFPGLGPSEAARNVGSGLLSAILFGSMITALHGLSLLAHAKALGGVEGTEKAKQQVELFTNSTWAVWAVLTIITSAMAIAIVLWLRGAILVELRELQKREESKYLRYENQITHTPSTIAEAKLQAEYIEKILTVRGKIAADFAAAETWPLPAGALAAVSVAALSQMLNIATAVYTFATKGLHH
jgi:hypothetical protein